ncbi:MAG TPA: zinc ribbon domain-containing protein [Candidatus Scybalocola faecigallinarum]|uniref:Zinc ribbon domain-containing protein n=1 Tax=Candidatus Scybalocola faecigallinarum TaxID=2840941 RepID=A0A9D1F726_9FIRM|nr:zinc ribbon domain-containing protein [Candidatus Scybalocola faecigallinarum]
MTKKYLVIKNRGKTNEKKCSRCGKEYDSNVNFCTVCGQDLRDSTESSAEK